MSLSTEQKNQISQIITHYRGWVAFALGVILGLLIGYLLHIWQLLIIPAILAGIFATSYKRGILYGSMSVLTVYAYFLLTYIVTSPALQVLDVFIGIIGFSGMGIIAVIITLLIGFLVGLTGGYFGAVLHSLITWPVWQSPTEAKES